VDGIITFDELGTITSVNPAAEKIFGYGAIDMINKNIDFLIPGLEWSQQAGSPSDALANGEHKLIGITQELQGQRVNGTTFPLDIAVSETWTNAQRFYTSIIRDITERKRAETALQQAKDELSRSNEELERRVQARAQELQQTNAALIQTMMEEKK